jgi:hypothetical protein
VVVLVLVLVVLLALVLVLVLGDGDRGGDGDCDSDCGCDDERYLLKLSISSQYTVVRRLHFIVLVFLHSLLSLSISISLSLSCKSFVVSIRLEVAASSGHPPQKYIHSCPKYNHPLVSSTALKATRAPVQQSRPSLSPKVWRERP